MATQQQEVWLEEYLQCWNATEAARRAGYKNTRVSGHNNKERFADEIRRRLEDKHMSAEEALARMASWARADLGPYMTDDGEIDIQALKADNMTHMIHTVRRNVRSGVNQDGSEWETVQVSIKTHDAKDATKTIMQHLGILKEQVEHSGEVVTKIVEGPKDVR